MEPEVTSLKSHITELLQLSRQLIALMKEAEREAAEPANIKRRAGAEHWANQAIENISRGVEKIDKALVEKNPKTLSHLIGGFASLGRYVGDYNYSWLNQCKDIDRVLAAVCNLAGSIYILIDAIDSKSDESVKRALE